MRKCFLLSTSFIYNFGWENGSWKCASLPCIFTIFVCVLSVWYQISAVSARINLKLGDHFMIAYSNNTFCLMEANSFNKKIEHRLHGLGQDLSALGDKLVQIFIFCFPTIENNMQYLSKKQSILYLQHFALVRDMEAHSFSRKLSYNRHAYEK